MSIFGKIMSAIFGTKAEAAPAGGGAAAGGAAGGAAPAGGSTSGSAAAAPVATVDVAPILDRNAELRAEPQKSDWGRHVASIPNVVLVRWMNEDGVNVLGMSSEEWGKYIRRKLDDPDWRDLRVD